LSAKFGSGQSHCEEPGALTTKDTKAPRSDCYSQLPVCIYNGTRWRPKQNPNRPWLMGRARA
jgi:hypothetical protein